MEKNVFFSFDYERDRYRACKVRDICLEGGEFTVKGFWDQQAWDNAQSVGVEGVFSWINKELEDTCMTVVLIGHNSYNLDYVDYTISESCVRGNALLAVHIDKILDLGGSFDLSGKNPMKKFKISETETLDSIFPSYDWIKDEGEKNFNNWLDEALTVLGG